MLQKLKKRKSSGFTIIEVMIVLAIAGLIMLIVFLAVPALQRNAHNTAIKNDVSNILGAMNEYANNNNGTIATAASVSGNTVTIGTGCGTQTNPTGNCADAKVGYITTVTGPAALSGTPPTAPAIGTVYIYTNALCNGNAPTGTNATARNYVAYYALEGGAVQCTAS